MAELTGTLWNPHSHSLRDVAPVSVMCELTGTLRNPRSYCLRAVAPVCVMCELTNIKLMQVDL